MKQPGELLEDFLRQPAPDLPPEEVDRLTSERTLDVCDREETVTLLRDELLCCYLPLGRTLIAMQDERRGARLLVGVAGCPGCGKSVFALLQAEATKTLLKFSGRQPSRAAVWPLDGVHHPNDYLESHFAPGTSVTLKKNKGRPETFDVEAAIRMCTQLRSLSDELFLPAYNRRIHDPVEGQIRVARHDLIVIVEGNFLFMSESGSWAELSRLFDIKIFIDADRNECREKLIERHIRGGRSREDALTHYDAVDLPNTLLVERTKGAADIIVERTAQKIRSVTCRLPEAGNQ